MFAQTTDAFSSTLEKHVLLISWFHVPDALFLHISNLNAVMDMEVITVKIEKQFYIIRSRCCQ